MKQRIFSGPEPYGIKSADVNKDGNQDLIWFSGGHNVEIHLGEGNGRFAATGPVYDTFGKGDATFQSEDTFAKIISIPGTPGTIRKNVVIRCT